MVATNRTYANKFQWVEEGADRVLKKVRETSQANDQLGRKYLKLIHTSERLRKKVVDLTHSNDKHKKKVIELTKTIQGLDTQQKKHNTTTSKGYGLFSKVHGQFTDFIKTGATMAIGWQMITVAQQLVWKTLKDLAWKYSELEASLISIRAVTESTGRSYAEVMGLMTQHTDAFMSKTALAPGVMRLLSTSLNTEQIGQFIQAVKDGSAAMGLQADEQLPLLARGFKQLTANVLDNIGVTIYLDDIKRKAAKTYNTVIEALTEEQIHLELLAEMTRQTEKYQGLYNKQMDTAKGSVAGLTVAYTKLMEQISKGNVPIVREFIDTLTDWIETAGIVSQVIEDIKNKNISYKSSILGVGEQLDVMATGLAEYATKNKNASDYIETFNRGVETMIHVSGKYVEADKKSRGEVIEMINVKIKEAEVISNTNDAKNEASILLDRLSASSKRYITTLQDESELVQEAADIQDEHSKSIERSIELIGGIENPMGLLEKTIERQSNKIKELDVAYNKFSYTLDKTTDAYKEAKEKGGAEYLTFISENIKMTEGLQYRYDELSESVKKYTALCNVSKSILSGLQKEYDTLNKVLYPDDVLNRVDRYKEVLKEVEKANKNIIKAQEELRQAELAVSESRVEPEIMARMIKDEETARINLYKAEVEADRKKKEELGLRGQLKGRLKEVADAMSIEQANYDDLSSKLEKYKSQQKDLSIDMKNNRKLRTANNTIMAIHNGLLEDENTAYETLEDTTKELGEKLEDEKGKVANLAKSYILLEGAINDVIIVKNKLAGYTETPFGQMYVPGSEHGTPTLEPTIHGIAGITAQGMQQPSVTSNDYDIKTINIYPPNNATFTSIINSDNIQNNITAQTGG